MQLARRGRRTIEKKAFLSDSPKNEFERRRHTWTTERGEGMENNCVDYGLLMKMLSDLFSRMDHRARKALSWWTLKQFLGLKLHLHALHLPQPLRALSNGIKMKITFKLLSNLTAAAALSVNSFNERNALHAVIIFTNKII